MFGENATNVFLWILRHCLTILPEHFLFKVNLHRWICWYGKCCLHDINPGFVFVATICVIRLAAISTLFTHFLWKIVTREFPSFCVCDENLKKIFVANSLWFHSNTTIYIYIQLQPTRKENNWETEETMERAAVTLETERTKWPNLGCLWWWYIYKWTFI
jgi:hypothetical protein